LFEAVNRYLARPVAPADVVWSFSGVRPLLDDEANDLSAVTRDYELVLEAADGKAPLLSVFGGKLTTYRRLAEEALALLRDPLGSLQPAWTSGAPLPGGDIPGADFDRFLLQLSRRHPWLPAPLAHRYARAYGTRSDRLLGGASSLGDLGREIGDGLYEVELTYLTRYEWALTAEDVLWRRSKIGLRASPDTVNRLGEWLAAHAAAPDRTLQCA
ncbi:MAG: glycerol-3-phosphate dehydrogenase C-terminal domain-containing protein, partial [Burkholderiales bacterium]